MGQAVIAVNCGDVTYDGVTVKSGGAAFAEDNGSGGNIYRNCKVTPENPGDLLSTYGDALHSSSMQKGPLVEDCLFERMGDDGINIHGDYAKVLGVYGTYFTVECKKTWKNPLEVGDRIRVLDTASNNVRELPYRVSKVTRLADTPNAFRIDVVASIGQGDIAQGNLVYSPDRVGADFIISDTVIRNNRARGDAAEIPSRAD